MSELLRIRIRNIDFKEGYIKTTGKAGGIPAAQASYAVFAPKCR